MRVVCISDTHTMLSQVKVPDGDLLIHAGDHTFRGTQDEVQSALEDLNRLPHKHKVFIAGNHDFFFDHTAPKFYRNWSLTRSKTTYQMMEQFPNLTYLENSSVDIEGFKVYGSPYQPWFHGWAFNFPQYDGGDAAFANWQKVPDDTDILVTHGPPAGILDWVRDVHLGDSRAGDVKLRARIEDLLFNGPLQLHVFGHLHESYGVIKDEQTTFVNAAICTRDYEPTNPPLVIDL
jgi:predicted phosphodiesterase